MMHLDRGNKDQSPHRKVRSNHDLDFRKSRLLFTSGMLMIPAILLLIFWANEGGYGVRDWRINIFIVGSGLISLGCFLILLFPVLFNKDIRMFNLISFSCLMFGGLLYLLSAIGTADIMTYESDKLFANLNTYDNPDSIINYKDGIYWFGIHCLFAFDALVLAIDCISDLYFAQNLRMLAWSFPLLWTCWFAFGYWLDYHKYQLHWWQLCAKAGYGTIAISILILMALVGMRILSRAIGMVLSVAAYLGSILIWIYYGAIIKKSVDNGHDACLYIAIPFLLSGQTLFLLFDCLMGTKEPKDGAGAKNARPYSDQQVPNGSNVPANPNV
jgi:hypothetical protein